MRYRIDSSLLSHCASQNTSNNHMHYQCLQSVSCMYILCCWLAACDKVELSTNNIFEQNRIECGVVHHVPQVQDTSDNTSSVHITS